MTQYSKRMVIVHWLTLALLIAAWYFGDELSEATDHEKATLAGYIVHASMGGAVLLFTVLRLYFRASDGIPPPVGQTLMDKVAKGIHHSLYAVLFLLPATGVAIILSSNVGKALMTGDATLLPKDFDDLFVHSVHETLVTVLIALVVVHILGAIKHQFIMKDGLMERMVLRRKD